MDQELKDFQQPGQTAALTGMRREDDGFYVPQNVKWGTYYKRHAEALKFVLPFVREKKLAVQAGGHVGAYPVWLSGKFERVLTFEPDPNVYRALQLNCFELQVPTTAHRVTTFPLALGHGPRVNQLGGMVIALDTLQLSRLDLLCLDIEGGEHLALCGAINTIERYRPVILVEEAPIEHNQPAWYAAYRRACDLLESLGYLMLEDVRCGPDRIWVSKT